MKTGKGEEEEGLLSMFPPFLHGRRRRRKKEKRSRGETFLSLYLGTVYLYFLVRKKGEGRFRTYGKKPGFLS